MRVLHVYNLHRGIGGADNATLATVRALREGGMQVDEFVRCSRDLAPSFKGKLTAFAGGLYARGAVREFTQTLARQRPDIVHVSELYPLISPWVLPRCTNAGIPVVMSCYDYRLSCPVATHHIRGAACHRCVGGREHWCVLRNCRDNLAESFAYALRNASARHFGLYLRHVDRFLTPSSSTRENLMQYAGIDGERVLVNPCVVPLPADPVADPYTGRYVGFAGRFVREKGVEVMVEACRRAGLPMGFAGDAISHPAVHPEDDAYFVLTRSPEELAEFYRGARVIVVPSLWPETFGLVAAEAMSHGVPVIVSRIGALPETVGDRDGSLLVDPGNASELAEKLARIWDDSETIRRLGQQARARVANEFSPAAHSTRLSRIYEEVVNRSVATNQRR